MEKVAFRKKKILRSAEGIKKRIVCPKGQLQNVLNNLRFVNKDFLFIEKER
jgi:hypothetical protein